MIVENLQTESLKDSALKLSVTVGSQSVAETYDALVKKYARTIRLKGFRKGKAPRDVIERKIGPSLLQETLDQVINLSLREAFKDLQKTPLGQARVQDLPAWTKGESFTFEATCDLFPEVTLSQDTYRGIALTERPVSITDKHESWALTEVQERNAIYHDRNNVPVEKGHVVSIEAVEQDEQGEPIPGSVKNPLVFTVGTDQDSYAISDDLLGMTVGQSQLLEKDYPQEFPVATLSGQRKQLLVKIASLKEKKLPALNDELAQDVNPQYATLADLKRSLREELEASAQERIRNHHITTIVTVLIKRNPIELPLSMVRNELERLWRQFLSRFSLEEEKIIKELERNGQSKENMLTEWETKARDNLCSHLLLEEIADQEHLTATEKDVEEELLRRAEHHGLSVDQLKAAYPRDVSPEETVSHDIKRRKVFDFLLAQATISQGVPIDYNELMGLQSN